MRGGWTASGACISGSTAHPRGATRRASGGATATCTASAERTAGVAHANGDMIEHDAPPSRSHAAGAEVRLQVPALAVIDRALTKPTERVRRDFCEAPAQHHTAVVLADLHDVIALRATKLARVELTQRIAPEDVPGPEPGIVDAQGRAVEHARQDPHVLDGAPLQHPAEMDLASPFESRAILPVDCGIHHPVTDQPAIELQLTCAIVSGPFAVQSVHETCSFGHAELSIC